MLLLLGVILKEDLISSVVAFCLKEGMGVWVYSIRSKIQKAKDGKFLK